MDKPHVVYNPMEYQSAIKRMKKCPLNWMDLEILTGEGNGNPLRRVATQYQEEPGRLQSMGSLGVGHD